LPLGVCTSPFPRAGRNAASAASTAPLPQTRITPIAPLPSGVRTVTRGPELETSRLMVFLLRAGLGFHHREADCMIPPHRACGTCYARSLALFLYGEATH